MGTVEAFALPDGHTGLDMRAVARQLLLYDSAGTRCEVGPAPCPVARRVLFVIDQSIRSEKIRLFGRAGFTGHLEPYRSRLGKPDVFWCTLL